MVAVMSELPRMLVVPIEIAFTPERYPPSQSTNSISSGFRCSLAFRYVPQDLNPAPKVIGLASWVLVVELATLNNANEAAAKESFARARQYFSTQYTACLRFEFARTLFA